MQQVHEKYLKKHPNSEWRYDLRVRYLPTSLKELHDRDKVTFHYYYDQVSGNVFTGTISSQCFNLKNYI